MDTVLQACLLLDQTGSVGHLLTESLRAVIRKPHLREPSASNNRTSVSASVLILASAMARTDGIRDDHSTGVLEQEPGDRVSIARRFQRDMIVWA